MNIVVVFGQMLVLFAMMFLGYFLYKIKWVDARASACISKLVVNVFNPVLIINGVLGQKGAADGGAVAANLALVAVYFAVVILFSHVIVLVLRPKGPKKFVIRLMTIFSNLGFMGIPVVRGIYGDGAVIYVAFYILGYNLLVYTYGLGLTGRAVACAEAEAVPLPFAGAVESHGGKAAESHGGKAVEGGGKAVESCGGKALEGRGESSGKRAMEGFGKGAAAGHGKGFAKGSGKGVVDGHGKGSGAWKRIINPGVLAALAAILMFALGIDSLGFLDTFFDYVGNATVPLSMMMIGISVAQTDIRKLFGDRKLYLFLVLRMAVLPAAAALLIRYVPVDRVVAGVFVIELGMPVGSIITLLLQESGADAEYCTRGTVLSTLASLVTIPLVCAFL